ncbi:hypothetical protein ABZ609_03605 [Streptomyces rubiginosohelvolus]|uniref:hypothetical protein n=1 Tax=Streptomyces rubiginosohelvolus TaxID=67362 RepID=UPI0033FC54BF
MIQPDPEQGPTSRVQHSGPHAKFCVLCRSGEHQRADDPAPTTRDGAPRRTGYVLEDT